MEKTFLMPRDPWWPELVGVLIGCVLVCVGAMLFVVFVIGGRP